MTASIQKNIQDRVARLNAEADDVSEKIRTAEDILRHIPISKNISWCFVQWDSRKKRIMYGDRPLIEAPLKDRIANASAVGGLIDAVIVSSEVLMGVR